MGFWTFLQVQNYSQKTFDGQRGMGERRGGCSSSRDIGEHEAGRKDPLEAPESGCPEDLKIAY